MMDKKLQDLAWCSLPKEFKEEVKKIYQEAENGWIVEDTLETIFGIHNLTSDAEGEEMLCIPKSVIQSIFDENKKLIREVNVIY